MALLHKAIYRFSTASASAAKSLESCPTLCDPIDGSPLGSAIPGILQARTLEWVAISFSKEGKWKVKVKSLSCIQLFETPWTVAYQAPPSMGFSRQEYWSGVPLPIKLPMAFFTELEQKFSQFVWKYKTHQIAKAILRKKNSWRNEAPWLQTILQSYSNWDSMILAEKQKYRSDQWHRIKTHR